VAEAEHQTHWAKRSPPTPPPTCIVALRRLPASPYPSKSRGKIPSQAPSIRPLSRGRVAWPKLSIKRSGRSGAHQLSPHMHRRPSSSPSLTLPKQEPRQFATQAPSSQTPEQGKICVAGAEHQTQWAKRSPPTFPRHASSCFVLRPRSSLTKRFLSKSVGKLSRNTRKVHMP